MFALPPTDDRGEMLGERPGQLSTQGTHYRLEGDAAHPLVVLVNGIMDPPERMESTAAAMRDAGFRTLRYDHYGRGWSRAPAGFRYDAPAHIAQLCALLKELALAPVALFAHSMGAIVASLFAEQTPSVKALVLAAPAGRMRNPLPCFRGVQLLFGVCGGCGGAYTRRDHHSSARRSSGSNARWPTDAPPIACFACAVALVQALMGGPAPPGDWINDTGDSRVAQARPPADHATVACARALTVRSMRGRAAGGVGRGVGPRAPPRRGQPRARGVCGAHAARLAAAWRQLARARSRHAPADRGERPARMHLT
jgi:pimeloyl-ACP methyl ester carboxylesterase